MYLPKKLSFDYSALEPFLSGETIFLHYEKHYKGYVNKLNDLLKEINYDLKLPLEDIVINIDQIPMSVRDKVLYNIGGILNHELYFSIMDKNSNHMPSGDLKNAIDKKYGNFDNFKNKYISETKKLVGSGYTFLVIDSNNDLQIINMSNQESPYSYGFIPIMALDLWEHAYYLDYQNKKDEYINNFFSVVAMDKVNENYQKALK